MKSLAVAYRPQTFEEVVGQRNIIEILQRQLATNSFKHTYLFCGPSGDGKTTIARIFAKELNHGFGEPIEVDGASNNGVDNVRAIIEESKSRAIDCEYKVIIVDECHMLTIQAWNAFLKCLEEPSSYTIFIFCTTDPQKIPQTVQNRCQRFNLTKIDTDLIKDRLMYICTKEGFTNYVESCDYIAKLSNGGMRDAISTLEKASDFNNDLSINNVLEALGSFSYKMFLELENAIYDGDQATIIKIVETLFNKGNDMKVFIEQFLDFTLDINKYCLFKDLAMTRIPSYLEKNDGTPLNLEYVTHIENPINYYNSLIRMLLELKTSLRYDSTPKTTIEVKLINFSRGA